MDWAAEITAAVAVAATGVGGVELGTGTATRRVRGVPAGAVTGPWSLFRGELGQVHADGDTLLVGLGPSTTPEMMRIAGQAAGAVLPDGAVSVTAPDDPDLARAWVDGLAGGATGATRLLVDGAAAAEGLIAAHAVRLARLLTSAPANVLTPATAAAWAKDLATQADLDYAVLEPDDLRAGGFGALLAIGSGSVNGPRLVRLGYANGPGPAVTLVGKGVTFDSGGLSAKSPDAMQGMRFDVAGAAAALAAMAVLRRLGVPGTVRAVLPFAENLPGPGGARPGDVVTACDGTRIQIMDTDFEGRVILADALALAARDRPDLIVDLATLTYQAEIALGPEIGAVIGRDDGAVTAVLDAARAAGEPMWRLPWADRYIDQVRTPFGVRNHPLRPSGRALTAALFLGEFVPESIPWAHCDMAGPAWQGDTSGAGATGFGVRTLLRLLVDGGRDHQVLPGHADALEQPRS
ncbi:MAG TPA: peptidase M17 [Pseudonocardiaceae bacterium]|jgi:leucyl aminopeptidase|nr:peptidase M17 [Pseudonocardiaceae bacterium]